MVRRPHIALTAALSLSALLISPALTQPAGAEAGNGRPAARAGTVELTDAAEDVWVWSDGTMTWELWGTKQDADVLWATATHSSKAVRVVMKFDNLRKERAARYFVKIKTKDEVRVASVWTASGSWGGTHHLQKPNGDQVSDAGMTHEVSYAKDIVVVKVPRDLLGQPGWVRVSIFNELFGSHEWQDNPHNGQAEPVYTARLRHS